MSIPNSDLHLQPRQRHSLHNLVLSSHNTAAERPLLKAPDIALREEGAARLVTETLDSRRPYSILFSTAGQAGALWPSPRQCKVPPTREVSRGKNTWWAYRAHPHPISGSPGRGGSPGVAPGGLQQLCQQH